MSGEYREICKSAAKVDGQYNQQSWSLSPAVWCALNQLQTCSADRLMLLLAPSVFLCVDMGHLGPHATPHFLISQPSDFASS